MLYQNVKFLPVVEIDGVQMMGSNPGRSLNVQIAKLKSFHIMFAPLAVIIVVLRSLKSRTSFVNYDQPRQFVSDLAGIRLSH